MLNNIHSHEFNMLRYMSNHVASQILHKIALGLNIARKILIYKRTLLLQINNQYTKEKD